MQTIKFDLNTTYGPFKIMNATNGGPWYKRHANDQYRSNFKTYKEARIPYARNHDSWFHSVYGGPYAHDIVGIFPSFDADENDPKSYLFKNTDESILATLAAGTKTFYRLGHSIEHYIEKRNTLPPKDFHKWARICEHIVRHYTSDWSDGLNLDMPYWEIWNEPDLNADDSKNKLCWGGTKAQFFDLFEITAKHLKSCFPHLKIGGPALAHREDWAEDFLCEMQKRKVPIDFFSWHIYTTDPKKVTRKATRIRALLDKYGFEKAESILNEWNYVKGWTDEFLYSLEVVHGIKGGAFLSAVISEGQKSSIDMLMYYDTRPSGFNGAFDYYTYRPLKGYYALKWYGLTYDLETEIRANEVEDFYTLGGLSKDGKATAIITRYNDDDNKPDEKVKITLREGKLYDVYLVDKDHDGELIATTDDLTFDMPVHSFLLIVEK